MFQPPDGPISTDDVGFNPIDARQVSIPNMVTLKVEWALYKTSRKFRLVHNISKQAKCSDLKRLTSGGQSQPKLQGSTESLLYAKGEMLYHVKCPRIEASLDLTVNDNRCYKYQEGSSFQDPDCSQTSLKPKHARQHKKVPQGYLTIGGYWVAACPLEKILSPPTELQIEVPDHPRHI